MRFKDCAESRRIKQAFGPGFQLIGRRLGEPLTGFGGQSAKALTQLELLNAHRPPRIPPPDLPPPAPAQASNCAGPASFKQPPPALAAGGEENFRGG